MSDEAFRSSEQFMPLPPGRKRRSPRASRGTFDPDGDGRLLSLIRNATFISHRQLIELGMLERIKATPAAIRQRIGRYLQRNLIQLVPANTIHTGAVYQITHWGVGALESFGIGISSISSETEHLPSALQAPHFLDLNEVRLTFLRAPLLARCEWMTDPEVKAQNTTPLMQSYAKDYDAVVKLTDRDGKAFQIGLEYERTYKDAQRYDDIAQRIESERQLCCVLYVASSSGLVARLIDSIRCPTFPVCVTASGVLNQKAIDATVGFMAGKTVRTCTLRQYFALLKHPLQ